MSDLTTSLLGRKRARKGSPWPARLEEITNRLVEQHGTPTLGNFADPIKEIFYILLSARTTEKLYQRSHGSLFETFSSLENIADAGVSKIKKCVGVGGLGRKRSQQIKDVARRLLTDLGNKPAIRLRKMSAEEAFSYLTSLPGVGPKSALCIMMCSLGFDVFPVDVNVQRICERLGVLPHDEKHYVAQARLPQYVPTGFSKRLHVAMVVHGRKVCRPGKPKCGVCVIRNFCRYGNKFPIAVNGT